MKKFTFERKGAFIVSTSDGSLGEEDWLLSHARRTLKTILGNAKSFEVVVSAVKPAGTGWKMFKRLTAAEMKKQDVKDLLFEDDVVYVVNHHRKPYYANFCGGRLVDLFGKTPKVAWMRITKS